MTDSNRKILVTSALPYANGPLHLGHMVEYVQSDIWVRFQRLRAHECHFVCASDAHGTPVMLRAREEGISPEDLIERFGQEHLRDFAEFDISFDNYHSTHSAENLELVTQIFKRLDEAGHITRRIIRQAFDEQEQMFLPDRYVRGTCPRCGAPDQHGDSCEVCGATYTPADLIDPISVLSGTPPVFRDSEHLFFKLNDFTDSLQAWVRGGHLHETVVHKLDEWFEVGLRDWDISRDAPYFGFEIPGEKDKYFYVWLDAPVGYMASFLQYCRNTPGLDFDAFWKSSGYAELYHFIGKDIIYFHALFWPAVLEGSGYRKPTGIFAHGFLTVNGQKMSKTRGSFITARTYLEFLQPEYLRYYYASKLGPGIDDIDLNLDDFIARVNADLVGKLVNIASRTAGFIIKGHQGKLAASLPDAELLAEFTARSEPIASYYEQREYSRAVREIMALADRANQYVDGKKPWVLAKSAEAQNEVQQICTLALNLFRVLVIYLKPILPRLAAQAETFMNSEPWQWSDLGTPSIDHVIRPYEPLATRIKPEAVGSMIEASRDHL